MSGFLPWVPIPAELLPMRRAAVVTYLALGRYAGRDGRTTTGIRRLATDTGLHTESVVDAVRELIATGLVVEIGPHGRGRLLELPAMVRSAPGDRPATPDRTAVPAQSSSDATPERAADRAGDRPAEAARDCAGARPAVPAPTYRPLPTDLPTLDADPRIEVLPADPERARLAVGREGADRASVVEATLRELAVRDAQADPTVRSPRSPRIIGARLPRIRERFASQVREVVDEDPAARPEQLAARAISRAARPPDGRSYLLGWIASAGQSPEIDEHEVRQQCRRRSVDPDVEHEVVSRWRELRGAA